MRPSAAAPTSHGEEDEGLRAQARSLADAGDAARRLQEGAPTGIPFFRMGDFYEMFDDDAVTAHAALGITLTEQTSGIPMAGIPFHAAENYLRRLIEQGYRVAVCEQVQDPKDAKGVVERAVTRVITPGTLVDDSLLDDSVANEIAAVGARDEDGSLVVDIAGRRTFHRAFRIRTVPAERAVDEAGATASLGDPALRRRRDAGLHAAGRIDAPGPPASRLDVRSHRCRTPTSNTGPSIRWKART